MIESRSQQLPGKFGIGGWLIRREAALLGRKSRRAERCCYLRGLFRPGFEPCVGRELATMRLNHKKPDFRRLWIIRDKCTSHGTAQNRRVRIQPRMRIMGAPSFSPYHPADHEPISVS